MSKKESPSHNLEQIINKVYTAGFYLTGNRELAEQLTIQSFDSCNKPLSQTRLIWKSFCEVYLNRYSKKGEGFYKNTGLESKLLPGNVAVQVALLKLLPKERLAVILRDMISLDYREIADFMGCSKRQVSGFLTAGRWNLRHSNHQPR